MVAEDASPDPELALARANVPLALRPAMDCLWQLDERLGGIALAPNAPIAAIKLAWWREALERLDHAPPPAEPLLVALAELLLPAGIGGADLAAIGGGWDALIDGGEEAAALERHAAERGGGLFAVAATLLGGAGTIDVRGAGAIWALAAVPPPFATRAHALALARIKALGQARWPRRLRSLGVLAVLARDRILRENARSGSPRRVMRAFWQGISGY